MLGSHLEGPWIARSRAGAQFVPALRQPSLTELDDLVTRADGTVRLVTIAAGARRCARPDHRGRICRRGRLTVTVTDHAIKPFQC